MIWLWLVVIALAADIRGMTVSTPTWGWEWGTDTMARTIGELEKDGINWVAIHPYAGIRKDGSVSFRPIDPEAPPEWLVRPIREAHARGMKVLIKPHLAYWGSGFSWRGEIKFSDPATRAAFFANYGAWIRAVAAAAHEADAFCVGTELDGLLDDGAWRKVIRSVREVYKGPVTYAANWDRMNAVPFWDAVDVIGVQAYFPVLTEGQSPTPAALDAGWNKVLAELRVLNQRYGKHILFTELGYDAVSTAPVQPWRGSRAQDAPAVQEACMRAAFRAIDREPAVIGAFLWKWFPGEQQSGDFRMSSPTMRALLRSTWRRD